MLQAARQLRRRHCEFPMLQGRTRPTITVIARGRTFGEAIPFAKVEIALAHTPGLAMTRSLAGAPFALAQHPLGRSNLAHERDCSPALHLPV
jgi:hypothetical protein